jgi:hypothetical protein
MMTGDNKQQKQVADDEGSDKEGGKGGGNGDEGGGRATAMMVKKRGRVARGMMTRVVCDKEGDGDGGNMVRNNDNGLTLLCDSLYCTRPPLASTTRATTSQPDDDCRMCSARTPSATTKQRRR